MSNDDSSDREIATTLYNHLEATEELPVDRTASRWIGEAQAVAGDLIDETMGAAVRRKRAAKVRKLLEEVDSTGHSEADDHVVRARELAAKLSEKQ